MELDSTFTTLATLHKLGPGISLFTIEDYGDYEESNKHLKIQRQKIGFVFQNSNHVTSLDDATHKKVFE